MSRTGIRILMGRYDLSTIIERLFYESVGKVYWGVGGAGLVFVCPDDGTVFLQKRSEWVTGGAGQWAFPGGGIHPKGEAEQHWRLPIPAKLVLKDNDPQFKRTAEAEVREECGSLPHSFKYVDSWLYEDGGFKYKTFVASVPLRAKESWNVASEDESSWESEGSGWFDERELEELRASGKLFFGFTPPLLEKVKSAMRGSTMG